jgi:transcriptional regulator with XRE-family HTH domain
VLRAYRQKANLSQWELAERLGVGQNSVFGWESGKFLPRFDKIPAIVSFLGIPLEELFD